jgi:flagellar biosynthesis chaperone FliJ
MITPVKIYNKLNLKAQKEVMKIERKLSKLGKEKKKINAQLNKLEGGRNEN